MVEFTTLVDLTALIQHADRVFLTPVWLPRRTHRSVTLDWSPFLRLFVSRYWNTAGKWTQL